MRVHPAPCRPSRRLEEKRFVSPKPVYQGKIAMRSVVAVVAFGVVAVVNAVNGKMQQIVRFSGHETHPFLIHCRPPQSTSTVAVMKAPRTPGSGMGFGRTEK